MKNLAIEIARASKQCSDKASGPWVAIFRDGNYVITSTKPHGRSSGQNGIEWAAVYVSRPTTRKGAEEILASAEL